MTLADSVHSTPPTNTSAPLLARRAFLSTAALALPAIALAGPAVHAAASPDAELIHLAKQIADLKIQSDAAAAEYERCYEIYNAMNPQRSRKLLWRPGDPVGYMCPDEDRKAWCSHDDIDRLRDRTSFGQWMFIGTPQEAEKLGLQNWRDQRVKPVTGHDDLFININGEWDRRRAQELIEALDEYHAAEEAANTISGCNAADEVSDALHTQTDELFERMLQLKPSTLEGYQAMAAAVISFCWSGQIHHSGCSDQRMIAAMMASLTGAPINS
jgi:hypothetical protein